MKKDLKGQVVRIAEFLSIDIGFLASLLEKSSFNYMKKNRHKFNLYIGQNRDVPTVKEGAHINKGKTGGANELFTASMSEKRERVVTSHFADADPDLVKWSSHGGQY